MSGNLRVGEWSVDYYPADESGTFIISAGEEPVAVRALQQAATQLRKMFAPERITVLVQTVRSTESILESPVSERQTMRLLDEAFIAALVTFGIDECDAREMCQYGMGSDYRGWLAYVRRMSLDWLGTTGHGYLAEQLLVLTSAVAVSMRHGHSTFAYTRAAALYELAHLIPEKMREAQLSD